MVSGKFTDMKSSATSMANAPSALSGTMDTAAKALLVAAAFALALPTAWVSVFLIPLAVCWLLSGRFPYKLQRIRGNPAAWLPIVLFALYAVGVLYSSATQAQALDYFAKYHKLLYVPIIVSFLDDPNKGGRKEVHEMRCYADRTGTRSAATMRDGERLV